MPQEPDSSIEAAFGSATQALVDFEATIQEGRKLFFLDAVSSDRIANRLARILESLSFYLSLFFVGIGFTCIIPRRRPVRIFSFRYSGRVARLFSVLRLQAKHEKAAQSQQYVRTNRWRIVLIYLGPLMFFIGPNLVTVGSAALQGAAREILVALGSVVSAWPIFSTLLKKSKVLDLRKDLEHDTEDAIRHHNIQAADELGFMAAWNWAGYLTADIANVVIGSWAAFRKNPAYGIGNAAPDIVGLCIILPICIYKADKFGAEEFPHDIDDTTSQFNDFVSEVEETQKERRVKAYDGLNRKAEVPNILILIYALTSLTIHIVLILYNPQRRRNDAYVYDVAIPSIINFIAATYLMARLMQQMFPNYFLAHIRAEWGAHIWRMDLEVKMRDSFQKSNVLQRTVEGLNVPNQISEVTQRMKTTRDRIWYFRLVDQFPNDMNTPNGDVDMANETERVGLQNTFTSLRKILKKINEDYSYYENNQDLRLTPLRTLLVLSLLSTEADNQKKFARVEDYKRQLDHDITVYRISRDLYLRSIALDEQLSQLDGNILQYYRRLETSIPSVILPESSGTEAFMVTLRDLATPPTIQDPWYFNFPPLQFSNSIADRILELGNGLDELSHLEQRIRSAMLHAIANPQPLKHEGSNGREPERQEDNSNTSHPEISDEGDQIPQLRAVMEKRKVELVQWLRS
ncbi:hypothetical protein MMC12_007458 [Toensbergia leucococca]|nr:hypothetical protein [Toensbergia leucococca]